jgi:UDP-glucose 4-epimerase
MIGPALVNQLLKHAWEVRVLSRRPFNPNLFVDHVDCMFGDIRDINFLQTAMKGVDVAFHLAAKLHINNPSPKQSEEYHHINVDGALNVAQAAIKAKVKRLVHFSTIGVYGPSVGIEPYQETSSLNPQSLYALSKIRSEEGILKLFHGQKQSSAVILRLSAVYGPRLQGNYRTLVKALQRGLFWPVGSGENRRTLIYIDDMVRAAILAAEHPKAADTIFNVTDGKIHTLNEVLTAIAFALGKKPPGFHIPSRPVQVFSSLTDQLTNALRLPVPRLRNLVDKMMEDVAVSGEKICNDLSFIPRYDLESGWQAALCLQSKNAS